MKNRIHRCEQWTKALFNRYCEKPTQGIEVNWFWQQAEKAGLTRAGEYGGPMTQALKHLDVEVSFGPCHNSFILKNR